MLILGLSLALLSLLLTAVDYLQGREIKNMARAFARERNSWQSERQQLIDKVLLQKGYREFAPPQPIQTEVKEPEWEEESLEEGFRPL